VHTRTLIATSFFLGVCAVTGQVPAAKPTFQQALIYRVPAFPEGCNLPDMTGGPGTSNPTLLTIPAMRPMDLLAAAFGLKSEQIFGLTRWGFAWNGDFIYIKSSPEFPAAP
jgi:hypothetical protein